MGALRRAINLLSSTVIACCNAEGLFLSSILILKGINKKEEYWNGLPNRLEVFILH
jgi:hypothetical protein